MNDDTGRYAILGTIDGLLAVLGIIIGLSSTAAGSDIIVKAALGGGIALCLTNGIGSYLAESAVEYGRIASVEKAILQELKETHIEKSAKRKIIRDSLTHGGASLVGSVIPILPYLFISGFYALAISVILCLTALIALGFYSGKISGQGYLLSIIRMIALGLIIITVTGLLGIGR